MKRSGNHAIINWLEAHGRFIFFNNAIPIAPILRGDKTIPPPRAFAPWLRHHIFPQETRSAYFMEKLRLRRHSLIVSLEDHDLRLRPFFQVPCQVTNVLIVRDPDNLFASRIRKASLVDNPAYANRAGPAMDRATNLWKSHAREYLGLTDYLEKKVCIYFNSWFSSRDYRRSISRILELDFTDKGFDRVPDEGGGSSFDSTQFDGSNERMGVLSRQARLTEPERILLANTLDDPELQALARKL